MESQNKLSQVFPDCDIFCFINGYPVHIASMGYELPLLFQNKEVIETANRVSQLEKDKGFHLNKDLKIKKEDYFYFGQIPLSEEKIRRIIEDLPNYDVLSENDLPIILYCWSFVENARKGFYSFDTIVDNQSGDIIHRLVASPEKEYSESEPSFIRIAIKSDFNNVLKNKRLPSFYNFTKEESF